MKLWFAVAGAVSLLFAWLALRGPGEETLAAPVAVPAVAAPGVARALQGVAQPPAPQGIRLHGVLLRGGTDGAASQALLSVQGAPTQVVRVGEPVAQGWSLAAVAADHVFLAMGEARARIDVSDRPVAAADSAAPAVIPAVAAKRPARGDVKEEPLPGFQPTAAGSKLGPPGPANVTANRKFMQDMQGRLAAGGR